MLSRRHALAFTVALAACVRVPEPVEPLSFAADRAELDEPDVDRELAEVAGHLRADPDLHLLVVGHADEDNTDAYNRELSQRRAEHVRARILALAPELGERVATQARGEWDASDPGADEAAKARNRRVELRFYYPRQCPPSYDAEFVACVWGRLPPPEAAPTVAVSPAPEPAAPTPASQPPARARQDFRGPYLFGLGGYAISSGEYLRQHARWGLGAGYLWGFDSEFRLAAGLNFDHLVDVGFLFPQPDSCEPFCEQIDRSHLRVVPELRIGGARGGVWGWLRLSAGAAFEHREARLDQRFDAATGVRETVELEPERWVAGAVVGIGPGVAITLTRHLFLLLDATVTYVGRPEREGAGEGAPWSGAGIYDVGAGLGWIF